MRRGSVNAGIVGVCSCALFSGYSTPLAGDRGEPSADNLQKPPTSTPQRSENDAAERSAAIERLKAQIEQKAKEFQQRPRKKFIGSSSEYRFAKYEVEWRKKIERVGAVNFPPEARGKLYGNVRLSVSIRPDGTVESVSIDQSSGHEILDRSAVRIVELASPFAPFPLEIRKDTDLLIVTRTWFFTSDDNVNTK